ncbi:NAD(P)-dependent dehydrogenase (short-subunit alcohol dehydrogenase family) [Arthrobacter sp. SLBN-100]|uniref:SDR family NAD(P)-dependent oxidoreductase n=1 Tax=Arthrobacter sp. SLBN-100 TaxID=2768450 RepID=UPI001150F488|nr:SDR family oxidoreductase [Arthrobacter sp. SLBN-100]TQJ62160.1 NAD(P)-dependent dehydrogenase (short-subunit alcohol dehydrogenase family) [Arthrobacter sp. SLBN-100]
MHGLQDKVIVVAGGANGLGAATAERLGKEGARVLVGDLDGDGAARTTKSIIDAGGIAEAFAFDIADEESCRDLMTAATDRWDRIDGLYNVAADLSPGNLGRDSDVVSLPLDVLKHTIEVNLFGYFNTSRHAIPAMLDSGGGSIVHMTSGVVLGLPMFAAYGASKGGIIALSRHIAARWGKDGIRSNAVDPGITLTENQMASVPEELRDSILPTVRAPRYGEPAEIAAMVAFLFSDETQWINGQTYAVSSMAGAH